MLFPSPLVLVVITEETSSKILAQTAHEQLIQFYSSCFHLVDLWPYSTSVGYDVVWLRPTLQSQQNDFFYKGLLN